jgi:hypothetical protein
MITDLFKTNVGKIIISCIWGLALATIFRYSCDGKNCSIVIYKGPDYKEISQNVYNYGTKDCYKYKPVITSC